MQVGTEQKKPYKRMNIKKVIVTVCVIFVLIPCLIALGMTVWDDKKYYLVSLGVMILSVLPLLIRFEKSGQKAREVALLSVMTALCVASRAAFYMIPQFKPTAAIIIISGVFFGAEAGFTVGACTALVSNFFFGQGPWTPWQMFAFGVIGFLAGVLFSKKGDKNPVLLLCIFGGISVMFIYGIIMDTASLLMMSSHPTLEGLFTVYATGLPFNAAHAVSTVIFLLLLSKPFLKKLCRIRNKFGIAEHVGEQ